MTLTKPQARVLKTLDRSTKPTLPTSNVTTKKTVSGASATVLARAGLVRRDAKTREIAITAKGRKALARAL